MIHRLDPFDRQPRVWWDNRTWGTKWDNIPPEKEGHLLYARGILWEKLYDVGYLTWKTIEEEALDA